MSLWESCGGSYISGSPVVVHVISLALLEQDSMTALIASYYVGKSNRGGCSFILGS